MRPQSLVSLLVVSFQLLLVSTSPIPVTYPHSETATRSVFPRGDDRPWGHPLNAAAASKHLKQTERSSKTPGSGKRYEQKKARRKAHMDLVKEANRKSALGLQLKDDEAAAQATRNLANEKGRLRRSDPEKAKADADAYRKAKREAGQRRLLEKEANRKAKAEEKEAKRKAKVEEAAAIKAEKAKAAGPKRPKLTTEEKERVGEERRVKQTKLEAVDALVLLHTKKW